MNSRRSIGLVCAPLALAALLFGIWRSLARAPEGPAVRAGAAAERRAGAAAAPAELALAPPVEARRSAPAEPGAETLAAEGASFALSGARWIEGFVRIPPGAPPEPALEVLAVSLGDEDAALAARLAEYGARWLLAPPEAAPTFEGEPLARPPLFAHQPVAQDGSFAVPLAGSSRTAQLFLVADYLYLAEPLVLALEGELAPIVLDAQLGGRVEFVLSPPAGAGAHSAAELAGALVRYSTFDMGRRGVRAQRRGVLGAELRFASEPLPPSRCFYRIELPAFVEPAGMTEPLEAGRTTRVDIALEVGAALAGRVLDEAGMPVAEAEVEAESGERNFWNEPVEGATDLEGRFELRGVPAGETQLNARHERFLPGALELGELADREVRTGLELRLARGERVAGRALRPNPGGDAPLPAAQAELRLAGPDENSRPRETAADGDGRFAFEGLGPGPFALSAEWRSEAPPAVAAGPPAGGATPRAVVLKAWLDEVPAGQTDLAVFLEPTVSVSGRAEDERGQPIAEFEVRGTRRWSPIQDVERQQVADAAGRFELAGLTVGEWAISVQAAGHTAADEQVLAMPSAAELVFVLARSASVAGRVLDPSGAGAAAEVVARRAGERAGSGSSDSTGVFELAGLPAGVLELAAESADWAPSLPVEVEVGPGSAAGELVLQLTEGGTLTGQIHDKDGAPAAGREVWINASEGPRGPGGSANVRADATGWFVRPHLAPGSYTLFAVPSFGARSSRNAVDPAEMMTQLLTATAVISEGQTTHVVLGAPPEHPVRVTGRVTRGGEGVPRAMVMFFGGDESLLDGMSTLRTDEAGRFEVELDGPGDYTIVVAQNLGDAESSEFHETVPSAAEHHVELALAQGGIAGSVLDGEGRALEGASVSWQRSGAPATLASLTGGARVQSDAAGAFAIGGLEPGEYTLRAAPPWGPSPWAQAVTTEIEVERDRVHAGVVLRLARAGAIAGRVADGAGRPVRGAAIFVRDAAGTVLASLSPVETDGEGRFRVSAVPPGAFTVSARHFDAGLASAEVGPVAVGAEDDAEVALVLEDGTLLAVAVEDADGASVRAFVEVRDADGNAVQDLYASDMGERWLAPIASAAQRIGPLAAGRYHVKATAPDGRAAERPVTLRGGGEKQIVLRLEEAAAK